MHDAGTYLSGTDLRNLARACETLHDPFGFGTLDGWRGAVNELVREVVGAEVAIFFVQPPSEDVAEAGPVFSDELSADERADFVRDALFDAGTDRALAYGLLAGTQRQLVGEDWEAYYADPAVNAFYLPNQLTDAVFLALWDRNGRKEASIELYRTDFGTPLFGPDGAARLGLLLPALRAGVGAVRAAAAASGATEALLDAVGQPVALADAQGRLTFRSSPLSSLLASDPEGDRLWVELAGLARAQAAMFEARGWGCRHRITHPTVEAALSATRTVSTRAGSYQLSLVEAPGALNGGRHGFLLRVEVMDAAVLSQPVLQARFGLTPREGELARLLAAGASNDRIAAALAISPHTARRHTERIFAKLGVTRRSAVGAVLRGESILADVG